MGTDDAHAADDLARAAYGGSGSCLAACHVVRRGRGGGRDEGRVARVGRLTELHVMHLALQKNALLGTGLAV